MPPGIKLTAEVIEQTRKLAEVDGLSAREIAERMGVARGTILGRCHTYGIKLKGSKAAAGKATARKVRAKKAKPKAKATVKGFRYTDTLNPDQLEAKRAAARAANARTAETEKKLAAAAVGAVNLPLVTVKRKPCNHYRSRAKLPYKPRHYEVTGLKTTLPGFPGQCRFPMTEDAPFTFCGKAAAESRYCQAHHDICYQAGSAKPVRCRHERERPHIASAGVRDPRRAVGVD